MILFGTVVAGGCAFGHVKSQATGADATNDLVFLTRDGCVNTTVMRTNLDAALRELSLRTDYAVVDLASLDDDDVRASYGTPTVLYRNRDVFGMPEPTSPNPKPT